MTSPDTYRAAGESRVVPAQHRESGLQRRGRGADLVEAGVALAADHQLLAVGSVAVGKRNTRVRSDVHAWYEWNTATA